MIVPPQWYHLEWLMWFMIGSTKQASSLMDCKSVIDSATPLLESTGNVQGEYLGMCVVWPWPGNPKIKIPSTNVDEGHDFAGFVD